MAMPRDMSADQRGRSCQAAMARSDASSNASGSAAPKTKPLPSAGVGIEDRVGQAAGLPHDGHGAVAQGDHLALAAWFEARRHQERIGPA